MRTYIGIWFVAVSLFSLDGWAQPDTQINFFGHLDAGMTWNDHEDHGEAESHPLGLFVGEHDVFIQSRLHDRLSVLGEVTVGPQSGGGYATSIERLRLMYEVHPYFSVLVGKMHSPVNYWNDTYHHGRIFFPTIDRPSNFAAFVPIHTLGVRLQGQNIGKHKFGYDVVVGNGIESTEVSGSGQTLSYLYAVHFKPIRGARFGVSYYHEKLENNTHGAHAHAGSQQSDYSGPLDFQMASASAAYFGDKWEFLNEFAYTQTATDSLGSADNFSNYTYLGYRLTTAGTALLGFDWLQRDVNDLYPTTPSQHKILAGWRQEFGAFCNVKVMAEYYSRRGSHHGHNLEEVALKIQLAYAF